MDVDCIRDPDEAHHLPLEMRGYLQMTHAFMKDDAPNAQYLVHHHYKKISASIEEQVHSSVAVQPHPLTPNIDAIAPMYMVQLCPRSLHSAQVGPCRKSRPYLLTFI